MKNKSIPSLCENILTWLSPLICLENKDGSLISPKKTKIGINRPLEYQPDYPYSISDPRIIFMQKLLKIVLRQGRLFSRHGPIYPFAFRLRQLNNWLIKTNTENFLAQLAWDCGVNCVFCYQKGNPSFMKTKKRISKAEIKTRLKYFKPKRNLGLVGPKIIERDEVLHNPNISDIIKGIRKKDRFRKIDICTNGSSLDAKKVKMLAKNRPLLLILSLNSADPKIRKRLMKDLHPEVAIASLPLLKKHRIPFMISIVAWPDLPFSDIEKTIRYADENDAYAVRLCLPGYSRFFSKTKLFDAKKYWLKTIKYFHPLYNKFQVPIEIVPHIFIQNQMYARADLPMVIGTIKNSPAYYCGIRPQDQIMEINEWKVDSIEEARNLLISNLDYKPKIKVKRKKSLFEVRVENKPRDRYPYCFEELKLLAPFGIVLAGNEISHDDIKDIGRHISIHNAKNVLVLTSPRARPFLKHVLKKYDIPKMYDAKIRLVTSQNHFFGGSVDSADLLTVEDCIKSIKQSLKNYKPDLIILPDTPFTPYSDWRRDLTGRVNLDIEREIGIPTEFIYTYMATT